MVQVDCTHLGVASLQVSASFCTNKHFYQTSLRAPSRAAYKRQIQSSVANHVENVQHASLSTKVDQGVEQSLVFWNLQIYCEK